MPHDGQPEPQPAVSAREAGIGLAEALEDMRQELGLDAAAVVGDGELCHVIDPPQSNADLAAPMPELRGIRNQVPDHLLQAVGVAVHDSAPAGGVDCDDHLPGVRGWSECGDGILDHARQIDRPGLHTELSADDAGDVEDVLDQPGLGSRAALDGLEGHRLSVLIEPAKGQHAHPSERCRHRRAQLVGDSGQELVTSPRGLHCGVIELSVVEGQRDAPGEEMRQLTVGDRVVRFQR